MKKASKLLLTSVLTIALCISLIAGATFALFTDNDSVNITVSSGTVDVTATVSEFATYTDMGEGRKYGEWLEGSSAEYDGKGEIKLTNIVPGEGVEFTLTITNSSTVAVLWQLEVAITGKGAELKENLVAKLEGAPKLTDTGVSLKSDWAPLSVDDTEVGKYNVSVELPWQVEEGQGQNCNVLIVVHAVQGNANVEQPEASDGKTHISTESDLKAFRDNVNSGTTYEGQTIVLDNDIALTSAWEPIGTTANPFMGTFDGQGHTVSGMTIETSDGAMALGFFGEIRNATITHVKVSGSIKSSATIQTYPGFISESYAIGGICGAARNDAEITLCTNAVDIDVSDVSLADEWGTVLVGGILGYAYDDMPEFMGSKKIENCLNEGNIALPGADVMCMAGGITSYAVSKNIKSLEYVVNVGKLTGNESEMHIIGEIIGLGSYKEMMNTWYSTNSANLIDPIMDEEQLLGGLSDHYVSGAIVAESFGALDFDNIWTIVAGKLAIK